MRLRTAVAITTLVGTLGGLGIAVASGAAPWQAADLPAPNLSLECPGDLELGGSGDLSGSLTDAATGDPIPRHTVQVTRDDEFGSPATVGDDRTTNDGSFGPLSDTPANRGGQTYEATFDGNADYAPATATCDTAVHGTGTTLTAADPSPVAPGEDLTIVGQLETAAGDPVSDATITATDTVDGETPSELPSTSTDAEGGFTVTVPDISSGSHTIDLSYAGDPVLEPATKQIAVVLANDTVLTLDAPTRPLADQELVVTGELTTGSGDPVADAEITATDAVDGGTATDLTAATTDSAGAFAVTVPSAAAGAHRIDVTYAGDGPNKAATQQVDVEVRHETKLNLDGPATLPDEQGPMKFVITLTEGDGTPVPNARLELDDGGNWLRSRTTDETGQATYKKFGVTNEIPLRIEVTYAGDTTHWETSTERTWKAVPRYSLTKDQRSYVAGQAASLAVTTPDHTLPTTIELKPYRRPAIAITPSGDSDETLFTRKLYRNSTLTVSTKATEEYQAGSRTFTIRVAPRITQTLAGWYDTSGDTYLVRTTRDPRLDAKVRPARPGRCVKAVVQKYVDDGYRTVQTSRCRLLDTESTASFKLVRDPRAGARYRMRFVSPADDMNTAGRGDWIAIRYTR